MPQSRASSVVSGSLESTTSAAATRAARWPAPAGVAGSTPWLRRVGKVVRMRSGSSCQRSVGQSVGPPAGASRSIGPSPAGREAVASARAAGLSWRRNSSACRSTPIGRRWPARAWAGQPAAGAGTVSVAEKPALAMRVGMWLIESIRSICRPGARFTATWKSGSRTQPSRLAQSARVALP